MSLGSVAERFLFIFNCLLPPTLLPLYHPFPPWSLEIDSHLILCRNTLRDPVWDEGRKHYIGLHGNTSPSFSIGWKLEFWCSTFSDPNLKSKPHGILGPQ